MTARAASRAMLAASMVVGAAVRWWSGGRIGLWRDEVQFLSIASLEPTALLDFLRQHESHPPLFYLVSHGAGIVAGDMAGAMSLLLFLASVAAIPMAWWVATSAHSAVAGGWAAALVAFSLPLADFSTQVRPYALLSLLLLGWVGAMVRSATDDRPRWKALWLACVVLATYVHHAGMLLLAAALAVLCLWVVRAEHPRQQFRAWLPWVAAATAGVLPMVEWLAHQAVTAPHRAAWSSSPFAPFDRLLEALRAYPAELLLPVVLALLVLLPGRSARPNGPAIVPGRLPMIVFVALLLVFTLASYRSDFLVSFVVLQLAPIGAVAAGVSLALMASEHGLLARVFAMELAVLALLMSGWLHLGFVKSNFDQVARFIAAEARPGDLVLMLPGGVGPAAAGVLPADVTQVSYPHVGPIRRSRFDDHFRRVSDPAALQAVTDSLRSAARAGRRTWLVLPWEWRRNESAPEVLTARYAGLGVAEQARALLLRSRLRGAYGEPALSMPRAAPERWLELMVLERFDPPSPAVAVP